MTAKKRDSTHQSIKDALKACNLRVIDCSQFGDGFPDLVCVREDGRVLLVECKSDGGRMTGAEILFVMQLVNPAYRIFYDAEQAARAVMDDV